MDGCLEGQMIDKMIYGRKYEEHMEGNIDRRLMEQYIKDQRVYGRAERKTN